MDKVAAIILAGGKGTRMDILCHNRPKPLLPFAGKFRVIDFSLSNCFYSGISNIIALTDYQRSHMGDYIKRWFRHNASSINSRVLERRNGSYLGTADAVYQNLDFLDKGNIEMALVLAGDHIYKLDYRKMLTFHREVNADVTVGVTPVPLEHTHRFGTVTIGNDNRITDFLEKAPSSKSNLASMGIYVFNKNFLARQLIEDASNPTSKHDFGYSLLPSMAATDRVFAYKFDGYWQDIGTVEAYYEANMELVKEQPGFSLDGSSPILTEVREFPTAHISKQASVRNCLVGPGCVIKGIVENSVLSPRVRVDEQAVIRNSVIMEDTFIGRYSIVNRCVIDEGVRISDFSYAGFGSVSGANDITVLGKGATISSHTAIGRGCTVSPYVGISDFTTNKVTAGEIISKQPVSTFATQEVVGNES